MLLLPECINGYIYILNNFREVSGLFGEAGPYSQLRKPYLQQHFAVYCQANGDRGGTVVMVLCYKSEGRWFDSRWYHWNFSLT